MEAVNATLETLTPAEHTEAPIPAAPVETKTPEKDKYNEHRAGRRLLNGMVRATKDAAAQDRENIRRQVAGMDKDEKREASKLLRAQLKARREAALRAVIPTARHPETGERVFLEGPVTAKLDGEIISGWASTSGKVRLTASVNWTAGARFGTEALGE